MSQPAANPILIRHFRGDEVEAFHRGAWVIVKGDHVVAATGRTEDRCFVRSGAKFFQALPVLRSGAADRYGLGAKEIALMCASHGGEDIHVEIARGMLERGGLSIDDYRCGAHAPLHAPSAAKLASRGEKPVALHNNCSGKHAGMMLGAMAMGYPKAEYIDPRHPYQQTILETFAELAGIDTTSIGIMIDGCSAPTFALPLLAIARAFSRFATEAARPSGDAAPQRIWDSVAAEPLMIAGHDRLCTKIAEITRGRVISKIGADGFYGAMNRARGEGLALHVDDGQWNASERLLVAILRSSGWLEEQELAHLEKWTTTTRKNWTGLIVGRIEIDIGGGSA